MNIVDFFKGIGHLLARVFGLIKKLVPEDQLAKAIELARQAAEQFVDTAQRREWVVAALMAAFHIPESIARLITELAVQHLKADVIDKVAADGQAAIA
jgi:hypothetical protein